MTQSATKLAPAQLDKPGRGRIYDNILATRQHAADPLNRLAKEAGCVADIVVKAEFFNPLSSVKDRIGLSIVEAAEKSGKLHPTACWWKQPRAIPA